MQMYGEIGNLKNGVSIQISEAENGSQWLVHITIHPWPAAALLFRWKNVAIIQL